MAVDDRRKARTPRRRIMARAAAVLGLALLVAGFVVRDILARSLMGTERVSLALWVGGAVLVAGGLALDLRSLVRLLRRRRTAEQANALLIVGLVLVMAGLVCYISTRRFARLDWTGTAKHRLHSQTENILRALDRDIEATVVYYPVDPSQALLYGEIYDMLEEFRSRTPHLRVETIDLSSPEGQKRKNEMLIRVSAESLPAPSVVFSTSESYDAVDFASLVEGGPSGGTGAFSGEAAFAGAITKLTQMSKTTVYALTGHGEKILDAEPPEASPEPGAPSPDTSNYLPRLQRELRKDYYQVELLDLQAKGQVPEDCAALIIAGPRTPLRPNEIAAIRDYLDRRQGSAIVMVDSEIVPGVQSNMNELLNSYGIEAHTKAVGAYPQLYLGASGFVTVSELAVPVDPASLDRHEATKELRGYQPVLAAPCPLEVANEEPRMGLRAAPLLTGIQTSWGESDLDSARERKATYDAAQDVSQPAVVGAIVEPAPSPYGPPEMGAAGGPKIVVLGSSQAFDSTLDNVYVFMNCLNWMAGKTQMLGIPPKTVDIEQIVASPGSVLAARYVFMAGLPACSIALGVLVWLLRRR